MAIEFRNESNLRVSDAEPGSYFNVTDGIVLLRAPSMDTLRDLWAEFSRDFRQAIRELFQTQYGEIQRRYGNLGFRSSTAEVRRDTPYGMLTMGAPAKAVHFRKSAITQALIEMEVVPSRTPHGKPRTRIRGVGSVEELVLSLSPVLQRDLINRLVAIDDVDEWLKFMSGSSSGWDSLDNAIATAAEPSGLLEFLAEATEKFFMDPSVSVAKGARRGSGRVYAPAWFSQYLTRRGIWLWPPKYVSAILCLYPDRLVPLLPFMSVPPEMRPMADLVLAFRKGQRNTSAAVALQAFVMAAFCSNQWQSGFRWFPLAAAKERIQSMPSANLLSSSVNAVYKLAVEHFGEDLSKRPEAHLFLLQKRLGNRGVDAFNWCFHPHPRNTRVAERLLGRPVTEVPAFVQGWAREFRELLPLFEVKTIDRVEDAASLWLIYLMTLDEDSAPKSMRDIVRSKHVNDRNGRNPSTFVRFLKAFFSDDKRDMGAQAISTMKKGFALAARSGAFSEATNPFDTTEDRIGPRKRRKNMTSRKPLEKEVWELIVRMNRQNDYAFARSLGRYSYRLREPGSDTFKEVFWPAEAIIIDIILNSGMRNMSGRWPDSGEGDEFILDSRTSKMIPNTLPTATPGRCEAFLQLVDLPGAEKRQVIGMRLAVNKTGEPYTIPWVDPAIVEAVERIRDLQKKYNPISGPVKARKPGPSDNYAPEDQHADVYPLFRDPGNPLNLAVSEDRLRRYWRDLLQHCQDRVNELYGHEYPLISDGKCVFDIHALRVTMVSNLLEAGVSLEVAQDLVGHATAAMTWVYNGRRNVMLHLGIQKAMQERSDAFDRLAAGDREVIGRFADEAISPAFVPDHVGVQMLREYSSSTALAPFDIFQHGICPGGTCSTGGERMAEGRFKPVWRDRACSGCRYRVTGPVFKHGICNRLNNLAAELRLSGRRSQKLADRIEEEEARNGAPEHVLRRAQRAESQRRDYLSREYGQELNTLRMVEQVEAAARAAGKATESILLPAVPGFDPAGLTLDFAEVHEFELLHMLVRETQILPASLMEIPEGVEATWKSMVREILRANDMSELLFRIPLKDETDVFARVGDVLLTEIPEPSRFQQLVEGVLRLDSDAVLGVKERVEAALVPPGAVSAGKGALDHA